MINVDGTPPKISCLMVTANGRFETFQRAARCYADQTYPNRELVVVNEGTKDYQRQIAEHLAGRDDVRLIFLDGKYTLGGLRNIAIRLCQGPLFCQWDDDDFNSPERLALQYRFLSKHPRARVCYLSDQLHFYFNTKLLFWESWGSYHSGGIKKYSLIPGTIMAYRKGFDGRYPSSGEHCRAGEDTVLAYELCESEDDVLLLPDVGYSMVYSYHGKNVWDEEHHLNLSRERGLPIAHMLLHRDRICRTIDYLKLDGPIKVMGREGLAFTHGGEL